jgi:hypothetical protein
MLPPLASELLVAAGELLLALQQCVASVVPLLTSAHFVLGHRLHLLIVGSVLLLRQDRHVQGVSEPRARPRQRRF